MQFQNHPKSNRNVHSNSQNEAAPRDPKMIIEGFMNSQSQKTSFYKSGNFEGMNLQSPHRRPPGHSIHSSEEVNIIYSNSKESPSPNPLLSLIDKHQMSYKAPEELDRLSQTLSNMKNKDIEESSIQLRYGPVSSFDQSHPRPKVQEPVSIVTKHQNVLPKQPLAKNRDSLIYTKTVDRVIEKSQSSSNNQSNPISLVKNGSFESGRVGRPALGQLRPHHQQKSYKPPVNFIGQITSTGLTALNRPGLGTSLMQPEQNSKINELKNYDSTKRSFEIYNQNKMREKSDEALTSRRDPAKLSSFELSRVKARKDTHKTQEMEFSTQVNDPQRLFREPSQIDLPQPNFKRFTIDDFEIGSKLGKGRFGDVFLARERKTNYIIALKILNKAEIQRLNAERLIVREIKIHSFTDHQNIIKLYGFFHDDSNIYLILEFAPDGEVYKELKDAVR
jgi:hypothetical protein